jgi:tetrathionate reductase subunit B
MMVIDIDRCWGCKSCTVSCKMGNSIPVGEPSCISVFRLEQMKGSEVKCDFLPVMCLECENPQCLAACPKKAISKNDEGIAVVDRSLCIGCSKCVQACPYGGIATRKDESGKAFAYKCDLCIDRRSRGGKTFCEQHCPGQVFSCLEESEAMKLIESKKHSFNVGSVYYVSNVLADLGKAL